MRNKLSIVLAFLIIAAAVFAYFFFQGNQQREFLTLFGNVDVRQVDLGFRVEGRVAALFFEEGDLVQPGMRMATLDVQPYTDQVIQSQAAVEAYKAAFIVADQQLKRRLELIKDGSVSQEDVDNAISSQRVAEANWKQAEAALGVAVSNLSYTEVFAPTEGTILTRIREPGTVVRPADPVYTLSVISPVWIRAFVHEPELGLIYPGMEAEIHTDTPGAPVYKGFIGFISPVAEFTPKTVETTQLRTDLVYRLRIYAENPDRMLRQGMPVTVRLHLKPLEPQK